MLKTCKKKLCGNYLYIQNNSQNPHSCELRVQAAEVTRTLDIKSKEEESSILEAGVSGWFLIEPRPSQVCVLSVCTGEPLPTWAWIFEEEDLNGASFSFKTQLGHPSSLLVTASGYLSEVWISFPSCAGHTPVVSLWVTIMPWECFHCFVTVSCSWQGPVMGTEWVISSCVVS